VARITGRKILFVLALLIAGTFVPFASPSRAQSPQVDPLFRAFYERYQGIRVLGNPVSGLTEIEGFTAQYFEKGRIEDHRAETSNPAWAFLYGRLVPEMMDRAPNRAVSSTDKTYADLRALNDPSTRWAVPNGYRQGVPMMTREGVFVPFDAQLRPVPGYKVPDFFWRYINRTDLFPGGWLHDVGLPMSEAFPATVVKNGETREIIMQAFERTVLSYDSENPPAWQIERGNIGTDALPYHPQPRNAIEIPATGARANFPLHVMARVGRPGERVEARVTWPDGSVLTNTFTLLPGEDGRGLLIDDMYWDSEGAPPQPPSNTPALLQIRSRTGAVLAQKQFTAVRYDDPDLRLVYLHWTLEEETVRVGKQVFNREGIARAALEELVWGPGPLVTGYVGGSTSIPTPQEVLTFPGRQPDWGPRVRVLGLKIENGVATADFSREMNAYGGGSARVRMIREQITKTLLEYSTVREVVIEIEGRSEGVLQP
jgi:hypothetical protein